MIEITRTNALHLTKLTARERQLQDAALMKSPCAESVSEARQRELDKVRSRIVDFVRDLERYNAIWEKSEYPIQNKKGAWCNNRMRQKHKLWGLEWEVESGWNSEDACALSTFFREEQHAEDKGWALVKCSQQSSSQAVMEEN